MSGLRKPLLLSGIALLLIFGVILSYAYYGEAEMRDRVKAPAGVDYGFIPFDLIEGRTHFESRDAGKAVFKLDSGPQGESRVVLARAACGVGALGVVLLVFRAFTKPT